MNLEFLEIGIFLNLEFFWNWNLWNYSFISRFNYQGTTEVVGNLFGIGIVLELFWNFLNLEFLEIGIILNLEFFWNWNLWNYSFISRFNYQDITEVVGNCLELFYCFISRFNYQGTREFVGNLLELEFV